MEPLVKADEVAKYLGLSKSAVFRLSAEGVIPSFKVPGRARSVRFSLSEVQAALERRGTAQAAS